MLITWLMICCVCLQGSLQAYPKLEQLEELLPYIKEANDQTLIVFDINFTLTMPDDPAFHMTLIKQNSARIQQWIKDLTEEEKFWLAIYIVVKGQSNLIEKNFPLLLASLQQKGIKTLALTACPSAYLPSLGQSIELREREFEAMGLHFKRSFPLVSPFSMTNFKGHYGCYPGFYHGILFCNCTRSLDTAGLATKDEVLVHFLEKIHWKPEYIVMVDDEPQNLDHMAQAMQALGVHYTGLHYIGAQTLSAPNLSEEAMHNTWAELIQQVKEDLKLKAAQESL